MPGGMSKTAEEGGRGLLWRGGAMLLFVGLPCLLITLAALSGLSALETGDAADRSAANASAIEAQFARSTTPPRSAADESAAYLTSASESLARAELQNLTARLVETAAGHLIESQIPDGAGDESNGQVAIQLTVDIGNDGLLDLLYAIETGLPFLSVPELSARPASVSEGERADNGPLHVQMTVRGLRRGAAP